MKHSEWRLQPRHVNPRIQDEVNEDPVVYHWKYKLEEIDSNEDLAVDTLQIKKSS